MKIKLPDYTNCLVNLANSILQKFGVPVREGSGLSLIAPYLEKDYDNIVVLLLDGMGKNIIDRNLEEDGLFRTHLAGTYSSVFPPTTVAATTSVLSGKEPCEHSWLGWDCYYPQIDKNITVFLNREQGTEQPAADYNVAWTYCGYESVVDRIQQSGQKAYLVTPFAPPCPEDFPQVCERIKELCEEPGKKYIYGYWNEPDHIMHEKGCYGPDAREILESLERQVQQLYGELKNTLLIVTADHGHMDSKAVSISDYPRICECLIRMPSIEPRALNLFVKPEKRQQFEEEFARTFGEKFILWPKEKVLAENLFGSQRAHENFRGMLGDYLAIAVDDLSIFNTREEAQHFIGVHAGMTEDEMIIPLIVLEKS